MNFSGFSVSAIRILPHCDEKYRKCLKDEWYLFNDSLNIEDGHVSGVKHEDSSLQGFYGKNIHVNAIVGINGSGKSSLLELEYRIINNLSCILNLGKRRWVSESETLYYVDGLYAQLYYVVGDHWGCISCEGNTVKLKLPGDDDIKHFKAFPDFMFKEETVVLMKDFIEWARQGLFYTIVTNYSIHAFLASDYLEEPSYLLGGKRGPQPKDEVSWINGLFHKNDGYTTPLVLNPRRENGVINVGNEYGITLYRLSSCFIHARNNKHQFIRNYELHRLHYDYNPSNAIAKLMIRTQARDESIIWNYRPSKEAKSYADVILSYYGFTFQNLDWDNDLVRNTALYLACKTLYVAKQYPGYEEFREINDNKSVFQSTTSSSNLYIEKLVNVLLSHRSHETVKIHQAYFFLKACKNTFIKKSDSFDFRDGFDYDNYVRHVGGRPDAKKMYEILEYLPPSIFTIKIELDHFDHAGNKDNDNPIPFERLSSGERQYLFTFSTYIYHMLNILSIQHSNRVRYRCLNIILDEVELCFHPEYQRLFIHEFLGYIQRMNLNINASINIQLATHSPFVLSDMMEKNVLYLQEGRTAQKDRDFRNPFCANICDLLYQSFFLENGFYGEFSRKKVNEVFHLLNENHCIKPSEVRYIQAVEKLIGDEFLKMHLHQLMDKRIIPYEKASD